MQRLKGIFKDLVIYTRENGRIDFYAGSGNEDLRSAMITFEDTFTSLAVRFEFEMRIGVFDELSTKRYSRKKKRKNCRGEGERKKERQKKIEDEKRFEDFFQHSTTCDALLV